jgi:hypothetical protein
VGGFFLLRWFLGFRRMILRLQPGADGTATRSFRQRHPGGFGIHSRAWVWPGKWKIFEVEVGVCTAQ